MKSRQMPSRWPSQGTPEPEDPFPTGCAPQQDRVGYGFLPTPGRHLNGTRALWWIPGKDLLRPQRHLQDRVPPATRHRANLFSWDQTPLRGKSNLRGLSDGSCGENSTASGIRPTRWADDAPHPRRPDERNERIRFAEHRTVRPDATNLADPTASHEPGDESVERPETECHSRQQGDLGRPAPCGGVVLRDDRPGPRNPQRQGFPFAARPCAALGAGVAASWPGGEP